MRQRQLYYALCGLVVGLNGCSWMWVRDETTRVPLPPPGEAVPIRIEKVDDDAPKRMPKATTCVKWGDWFTASAFQTDDGVQRMALCDKARLAYEEALQIDHQNAEAFIGLARLYEKWEKPAQALSVYQQAAKDVPIEPKVWFEYGMYMNRQQEWDHAAEYLSRACSLNPTNPTYANFLGWTLARAGRPDESMAQFRKTVGEARAYYNLARMFHHKGQDDLCRKCLEAALHADPNLKDARLLIAQLDNSVKADEKPVIPAGQPAEIEEVRDDAETSQ